MRRIVILFVCLFVFAAAVSSSQSAPKYRMIDLGVLPGYTISEAFGINDSGTVVGICIKDQPTLPRGFVWTQQTGMVPITMPPGDNVAVPMDVNDAGYITGWSHSVNGNNKAVIWGPDGSVRVIQENSDARGINDKGQVCGQTNWSASMWDTDGTRTNIGYVDGYSSGYGEDINNFGTVVGTSMGSSVDVSIPFIWSASKGALPLAMPEGATTAYPMAINDAGDTVGFMPYTSPSGAVCWKADGSIEFLTPEGMLSAAEDINNHGQIVGEIESEPVLWNPDGTVVKLAAIGFVYAINDKGWVVGSTYSESQGQHATLWLPSGEQVTIDIKPGDNSNMINMKSKGTTLVAVMGDKDFDAAAIDPSTVVLAGAPVKTNPNGKLMASCEDVNGDGCMDMVLRFCTQSLNLAPADTKAGLEGKTVNGTEFGGEDSVTVR